MSALTLQSKFKLNSGHEIPRLGYGVSFTLPPTARVLLFVFSSELANIILP